MKYRLHKRSYRVHLACQSTVVG